MRLALILVLVGCGAAACGAEPASRPPLPEGRGVYTVRFNPPPCLSGRPELQVEVQTPQGWERVALELSAEGEEDLVAVLLERFAATPDAAVRVDARFTSELVAWSGRHHSRVFRLFSLDPEAADEP